MKSSTADRWIAGASVVTAIAALGLASWQGYLEHKYRRLELQPRVAVSFFYNDKGSGFIFTNAGAGPAVVHWTKVSVDGKVMSTWLNMGAALGFKAPPKFAFMTPAHVWQPGTDQKIFWVDPGPLDVELRAESKRVEIETCYCSVFEECWLSTRTKSEPRSTDSCLPKPEGYLRSPPTPPNKAVQPT
jgi:hypothetical protein